jgi:hypothetical protein
MYNTALQQMWPAVQMFAGMSGRCTLEAVTGRGMSRLFSKPDIFAFLLQLDEMLYWSRTGKAAETRANHKHELSVLWSAYPEIWPSIALFT